jgi:hypothetical protein
MTSGSLKPILVGVGSGTLGSVIANQIPQNQHQSHLADKIKPHHKKGKIKKALVPVSDDPYFNQAAAQKAFDLVMKMDDDTAEVFTQLVVSDMFEQTVEENLDTLQRHLNDVLAKRADMIKRALVRVAKSADDPEVKAYAEAVDMMMGISKAKNQYSYGAQFNESDYERDPGSGRFQIKITQHQTKPLHDKTAKELLGTSNPKGLSGESLTRFQDEYRQLGAFLRTINAASGGQGNQDVLLQFVDANGDHFTQMHHGTTPPKAALADPDTRLVGAIAKPTTLTAGGAAYGLAGALGGTASPGLVHGLNTIESQGGTFTNQWLDAGDEKNTNARLYGRLASSGEFMSALGPPGSKTQLAGKFAQIVGQAGPQAEAVLGPTTRKTAYRYRGTEKTPDKQMTRAYSQAVSEGKRLGLMQEEEVGPSRGSGRQGHGSAVTVRSRGGRGSARTPQAKAGAEPALHQMATATQSREDRSPTWDERELGRQVVVQHLRNRMPSKKLYELQLASGNTPPSEGVIINADGQLVTQAIGYGDDHYLPFNLKNLKGLKGGEYIRTRSVGGLTSEDVYTALAMGARQVTVTSRSGTYTMTFESDFRGGRRHNDKARRMTRRYEQLLDAVQSQQVDRVEIDPDMRAEIEREVKEEMSGPGWRPRDIQEAITERINEFKESPYITEQDEKRAEVIINSRAAGASESERNKIRNQVMDELLDQKETKFRLNSAGYKGALDALREQFPYYIKSARWTPPRDEDSRIQVEPDRGYVEPGRNRPTAAAAGLFGHALKPKYAHPGGKFSAAEADYQGARQIGGGRLQPVDPDSPTTPGSGAKDDLELTDKEKRRAAVDESRRNEAVIAVAKKIQEAVKLSNIEDKEDFAEQLAYDDDDLKDPVKFDRFTTMAQLYLRAKKDFVLQREWETAIGNRDPKPFSRDQVMNYPKVPPTFKDKKAYLPGADDKYVYQELQRLDAKTRESPLHHKPYSALTETEHRELHSKFRDLVAGLSASKDGKAHRDDFEFVGLDPNSAGIAGLVTADDVMDRMELQQRVRSLTAKMSEQTRAGYEHANRTVITREPQTQESQDRPAETALWNARFIAEQRARLEALNAPAEDIDVLLGAEAQLDNAVANNQIVTHENLTQILNGPEFTRAAQVINRYNAQNPENVDRRKRGPNGTLVDED